MAKKEDARGSNGVTRLIFVRHGETEDNAMDMKLGNTAVSVIEVSPEGHAKAVCLDCMKHL